MRVGHVQPSRSNYYDRTSTPKALNYSGALVAPASATTRWTYTVPAGKKAFVQSTLVHMMRDAVAGAAGDATCYVLYTPAAGVVAIVSIVEEVQNAIGAPKAQAFQGVGLLAAGDIIAGTTQDSSTGGSYTFRTALWYVEFDA